MLGKHGCVIDAFLFVCVCVFVYLFVCVYVYMCVLLSIQNVDIVYFIFFNF